MYALCDPASPTYAYASFVSCCVAVSVSTFSGATAFVFFISSSPLLIASKISLNVPLVCK